jgi:acyl-CoA synthetase (AMP-forming)/AMP-acid ligase II
MFLINNCTAMLALLQQKAQTDPDAIAYVLPDRVITYRRFWSRIERACARLQGEWGVRRSDIVAYVGNGHPDALILYFALLRLSASLLPLESLSDDVVRAELRRQKVSLVVHDDGMVVDGMNTRPLQHLLEDWCHFNAECVDEPPTSAQLLLRSDHGEPHSLSVDHLLSAMAPHVNSVYVGEQIFSLSVLTNVILPALQAAKQLKFAAVEGLDKNNQMSLQQRTGS